MEFIKLFEPITINGLKIKNRIVMPAMALGYTHDFSFNDPLKAFYLERARGGVGLMTIGPVAIDPDAVYPDMPGLFLQEQAAVFGEFIQKLHRETGVCAATQLMHMGRNAISLSGKMPVAPSPIPSKFTKQVPKEMNREDIELAKEQFARSARLAKAAGFDFIEIIGCTGYLISQFLSPLTNQRKDEYGGILENRMRFGLEVIQAVRKAVGENHPIGIRIAGNEFMAGGNTSQEACIFASEAEKAGADAVNVTGGWHETYIPQLTTAVPPGAFVYLARAVKQNVHIPVFASNRLGNPAVAERALRSGACDMVCWGRPLLADPELPNKVKSGRFDEIVSCIACNQGCFDSVVTGNKVYCALNPMTGHEYELSIEKTSSPKTVMIAGGGPAGMQFAIIAAMRGHRVSLYEKKDHLGGQLVQAKASPGKKELENIICGMEKRMAFHGVKVHLNTNLDAETVHREKPDVLVVAAGAKPMSINVKGLDKPHVVNAWDVLGDAFWDIGRDVVIIGGSATGCETAHYIAAMTSPNSDTYAFLSYHDAESPEFMKSMLHNSGRSITVIDMLDRMAQNMGPTSRWSLMKSLKLSGVKLITGAKLTEVTDDAVVVEINGKKETIPADTVVLAIGAVSVKELAQEVKDGAIQVVSIGDAKSPRRIPDAIQEGFREALKI